MSLTSSPALRRFTSVLATGAVAVLVTAGIGTGTANAGPLESGALDCFVPTADLAVPAGTIGKDPNTYTDAEVAAMESDFLTREAALGAAIDTDLLRPPIDIDVYVHVVRENRTIEGGDVPRSWIREQMKYLNHSYRGKGHGAPGARTPFMFHLAGVDRTTNQTWYDDAYSKPNEVAMKTALRTPGSTSETLNLYLTNLVNVGLLGYARLPFGYEAHPLLDGVVVESQSLPGGSQAPYDLGGTTTHEVGHWSGLFHTFQGGCTDRDHVRDTPGQAEPTNGCPEGADTCASPGLDPIHNYMDYSEDACYNQFTLNQRERMIRQWFTYRDGAR